MEKLPQEQEHQNISGDLFRLKDAIEQDNTRVEQSIDLINLNKLSFQIRENFKSEDGVIRFPEIKKIQQRIFIYEKLNSDDVFFLRQIPHLKIRCTGSRIPEGIEAFVEDAEGEFLNMNEVYKQYLPQIKTINGVPYKTPFLKEERREQCSLDTFKNRSGHSFYLKDYALSFGFPRDVKKEIAAQIQNIEGSTCRVWLTLASSQKVMITGEVVGGNMRYDKNGFPIKWRDREKIVEDIQVLIQELLRNKKKSIITLHSSDLYKKQSVCVENPEARKLFIERDREILSDLWKKLSAEEKEVIQYFEFVNEPDHLGEETSAKAVYEFVKSGNEMIRSVTGKPISLGPAKIYNIGFWLPFLKSGDNFQVHWYKNIEKECGEPEYGHLEKNMRTLSVPSDVSVILGEAQGNEGKTDISKEVLQKARESGYDGVLFWFNNSSKINTKYTRVPHLVFPKK